MIEMPGILFIALAVACVWGMLESNYRGFKEGMRQAKDIYTNQV